MIRNYADHSANERTFLAWVRLHWADGFGHGRIIGAAPVVREVGAFVGADDHRASAGSARN